MMIIHYGDATIRICSCVDDQIAGNANSTFFLKRNCLSKGAILIAALLVPLMRIDAAEFFCQSGNVTCLIAAINDANGTPGEHVINLEPGSYTLQSVDNEGFGAAHGLPMITGSIRIQATDEDLPTVIQRDPNAPVFRIFTVLGELHLDGITVKRAGGNPFIFSPSIAKSGITSLENSIVTDSFGDFGTIVNTGTLRVIRSIIADNNSAHDAGGIVNRAGGNLLVENSTIARNRSQGAGGIRNDAHWS